MHDVAVQGVDLDELARTIEAQLTCQLQLGEGGALRSLEEFDEAALVAAFPNPWGRSFGRETGSRLWLAVDFRRGVMTLTQGVGEGERTLMTATLAEAVGLAMRARAAGPEQARGRDLCVAQRRLDVAADAAANARRWLTDRTHPAHETAIAKRADYEARRDAAIAEHESLAAGFAAFEASPLPGGGTYSPARPQLF